MIRNCIGEFVAPIAAAIGLLFTPGCASEQPDEGRGALVSAEELATPSQAELQAIVTRIGLPELDPRNGIAFHRLVYMTVDVDGRLTEASGMVVAPTGKLVSAVGRAALTAAR